MVATLIFVHGTSVRKESYVASQKLIDEKLNAERLKRNRGKVLVADCLWGDTYGSKPASLSIPEYRRTGGKEAGIPASENDVLLWEMLGYNSLYELSGLALQPQPGGITFETDIGPFREKVEALPSQTLAGRLAEAGVGGKFTEARDYVLEQPEFEQALIRASSPAQCRMPVARAIVAEAMDRAAGEPPPRICIDPHLRDAIVSEVADEITPPGKAPPVPWILNKLFRGAQRMGAMHLVRRRRGRITDLSVPLVGDILLYQAKGEGIRQFIRKQIHQARTRKEPVVLLAHSLGGVACVDLLIEDPSIQADLLVTVGSQAPLFYELNALSKLSLGDPLPRTFVRRWVNIYDPRDFLGYLARGVFPLAPDCSTVIIDQAVDNKLPFPDAHSGYWANDETWKLVAPEIPD